MSNQIKDALLQGLEKSKHHSVTEDEYEVGNERRNSEETVNQVIPHELICTRTIESIHMKFNLEAASLLPLACRYVMS